MSQTVIKFGHDGWYGEIAREITFDSVQSVARAAGIVISRGHREIAQLAVGFDRRFLSDAFAGAVARVLAANGIGVWLTQHPLSAPAFAYSVHQSGAAGGIYISGAAFPANVSGIRLIAPDGGAFPRWMLDQIEELIARGDSPGPIGPTSEVVEFDPTDAYLAALGKVAPIESIRQAGITLAIDPMWGTTSELLPRLTDGGGSRSVEIRTGHNPRFPEISAPVPIASNLLRLRKIVTTSDAVFGAGLSGDGCSVMIVDEQGRFLPPGTLLALIAHCLLNLRGARGSIARTIDSSSSVDAIAEMAGVLSFETAVGHTAVCESLRDQMPLVMGDSGGGIIMPNHILERDGVLATMLISACVVGSGQPLSELVDEVTGITGERVLASSMVPLTDVQSEILQAQLVKNEWPSTIGELQIREIYQADGVKFELDDDVWLLIRHDELEQCLELVAESHDEETTDRLLASARQVISV